MSRSCQLSALQANFQLLKWSNEVLVTHTTKMRQVRNLATQTEHYGLPEAAALNWLRGVARSGVKGPLMWGSRVERSISTICRHQLRMSSTTATASSSDLIVFAALVRGEVGLERFRSRGDGASACALEIVAHASGVGENATQRVNTPRIFGCIKHLRLPCGGPYLRPHVADCTHARA